MFKKNFLTSALFAVLFSVSVSFASYVPEDAFTAEEFDDVLDPQAFKKPAIVTHSKHRSRYSARSPPRLYT